jgi:ferrous iron transport protein A
MKHDGASDKTDESVREGEQPFPLTFLAPGREAVIVEVTCPGFGICRRLADMGLLPGTQVRVAATAGAGGLIVEREGCRMAVGRGMGHRLLVLPVDMEKE